MVDESNFVYFKPKSGALVKVCVTGRGAVYRWATTVSPEKNPMLKLDGAISHLTSSGYALMSAFVTAQVLGPNSASRKLGDKWKSWSKSDWYCNLPLFSGLFPNCCDVSRAILNSLTYIFVVAVPRSPGALHSLLWVPHWFPFRFWERNIWFSGNITIS